MAGIARSIQGLLTSWMRWLIVAVVSFIALACVFPTYGIDYDKSPWWTGFYVVVVSLMTLALSALVIVISRHQHWKDRTWLIIGVAWTAILSAVCALWLFNNVPIEEPLVLLEIALKNVDPNASGNVYWNYPL